MGKKAITKPFRSEARSVRPVVFREEQREEIEKILKIDVKHLDFEFHKQLDWDVKQFHIDRVFQEGDDISGPYPKPDQTREQLKKFHKEANKFINCLSDLDDITLRKLGDPGREWNERLLMRLKYMCTLAERGITSKGKTGPSEDEALNAFIFRLAVLYFRATGKPAARQSRGESKKENKFILFVEYLIKELRQVGVKKEHPRHYLFLTRQLSAEALDELIRKILKKVAYKKEIDRLIEEKKPAKTTYKLRP